jgi:hypothetical protein
VISRHKRFFQTTVAANPGFVLLLKRTRSPSRVNPRAMCYIAY